MYIQTQFCNLKYIVELELYSDRETYVNWIQYRIRFLNFIFQKVQNLNRLEILKELLKNINNNFLSVYMKQFIIEKIYFKLKYSCRYDIHVQLCFVTGREEGSNMTNWQGKV